MLAQMRGFGRPQYSQWIRATGRLHTNNCYDHHATFRAKFARVLRVLQRYAKNVV